MNIHDSRCIASAGETCEFFVHFSHSIIRHIIMRQRHHHSPPFKCVRSFRRKRRYKVKMFQLILQMAFGKHKQLTIRHSQAANDIKINLVSLVLRSARALSEMQTSIKMTLFNGYDIEMKITIQPHKFGCLCYRSQLTQSHSIFRRIDSIRSRFHTFNLFVLLHT